MLASVVQVRVLGFQSSAGSTACDSSLKPDPWVPPTTRTSPVGRTVEFIWRRRYCIEPVNCHDPPVLRSMVSAVLSGGSPPPTMRILPGAYMTDPPHHRNPPLLCGPVFHSPLPDGLR